MPNADREIVITRHMKAPQALVWKACTEPEHIDRWWGPDGFVNRTARMEFRVGGEWEYTMTGPDGKVWPNLITYRAIVPITRLFYDHGEPGNPRQFEGELRFEEQDGGTLVTLRTVFPTKEIRDHLIETVGAIEGGKQTLAHLDEYTQRIMNKPKPALFNFSVRKEDRTITVERSFNAPLDPVWAAFTEADILCQWWAPKPYVCVVTGLDLRAGGRWSYHMKGPEGDCHYCFFDYEDVRPKSYFSGSDGFCDEAGNINVSMPRSRWENHFNEKEGSTVVRVKIHFSSTEDLERIIEMGFKEGFTMGLDQLGQLFTDQKFYHGTKADLKPGDLIEPGNHSNYGQQKKARFVYLTAMLDAATWGAELAQGEGRGRIYIVEPTGHYENDPNLTDKRFKGNPTKSYRTKAPLRVIGEVKDWQGHAPEQLQAMKDHLQKLKEQGIEAIED